MKNLIDLHPKAFAAANLCRANNDVRRLLNGVHVYPREQGGVNIIATNGHHMLHVTDFNGQCARPVILRLPTEAIQYAKAKWASRLRVFTVSDMLVAKVSGYHPQSGEFIQHIALATEIDFPEPNRFDWTSVIPSEMSISHYDPARTGEFVDGLYLSNLAQAAKVLGCGCNAIKVVPGYNKGSAHLIYFGPSRLPKADLHARAVIMGVRGFEETWEPTSPNHPTTDK